MLIFTSTEPGFMSSAGSEPFVTPKPDQIVIKDGPWRGLYLHGKAEDFVGYDIPTIVEGTLEFQPEQECLLIDSKGQLECILVAWKARCRTMPDPDMLIIRGLICAKTDEASLAYARKCSAEKRDSL